MTELGVSSDSQVAINISSERNEPSEFTISHIVSVLRAHKGLEYNQRGDFSSRLVLYSVILRSELTRTPSLLPRRMAPHRSGALCLLHFSFRLKVEFITLITVSSIRFSSWTTYVSYKILIKNCYLRGFYEINREPAIAVCQLNLQEIDLVQTVNRRGIGRAHAQQFHYVLEILNIGINDQIELNLPYQSGSDPATTNCQCELQFESGVRQALLRRMNKVRLLPPLSKLPKQKI